MASSSTSSVGNPSFSSTYASDLQAAITRAVSFASLPVQILQNKQNDLTNQNSELSRLSNDFQALGSALTNIEQATTTGSLAATSSDNSILTTSISAGAKAGTYSVNIGSLGAQTNTMSPDGLTTVSDPSSMTLGSGSGYNLTVDGKNFTLSGSLSNLNGLADAINASGAGVSATVINVGGTGSPDYRLSVLGNKYAPTTIQLTDSNNTSLLNTLSAGSYVTYQVNGQPSTPINSDSRTLNFAAGLSVTVNKTGSATVNVTTSSASLASALNNFASAYNTAFDELSKSRGQNGGALSGQSIVSTLSQSLRDIASSGTPSGSIQSIADLGLTYDKDGHLNFDASVLSSAMTASPADVATFLGSSSSGFLKAAESIANGIDDSTDGVIAVTQSSNSTQLTTLANKISTLQDRITLMQTSLQQKMTKADTLISSLQSQTTYYTNLFQQMRANQQSGF